MRKNIKLLYLFLCLLTIQSGFSQSSWYVDDANNVGDIYTKTSIAGNNANAGSATAPFATLQYAIDKAANGDFIYVDKAYFNKSTGNRDITINKSVTIIGAGTGNTIFSSHTDNRFAKVTANNVTIRNIQIYDFFLKGRGQALLIETSVTGFVLENVVMSNNLGDSGSSGESVYLSNGSKATFKGLLFSCSGFNGGSGGAIKVDNATLNMFGSLIKQSQDFDGNGGALEMFGADPKVTITDCTFDNNSARKGGAISQSSGDLIVTGSCFSNNHLSGDSGTNTNGGAHYFSDTNDAGDTASFTNCSFTGGYFCGGTLPAGSDCKYDSNPSNDGKGIAFRSANGIFNFNTCYFSNANISSGFDNGLDFYLDKGPISLNVTINNCTFGNDQYGNAAGASTTGDKDAVNIWNEDLLSSELTITNSGIIQTTANQDGINGNNLSISGSLPGTTNNLTATALPVMNCFDASMLVGCSDVVNCSTENVNPIIFSCVPNKIITDCTGLLPDYTSEVSAYDDCSFSISQSPAPGTPLSTLSNGDNTITITVTDLSLNTSTCSFNINLTGCVASCTNPTINTQPSTTQSVCLDKTPADLSVSASGATLTYQWYSNTTNNNTSGTLITGADNTTYTPATNVAGTTYYYVVITSVTCKTTSNTSAVVVNNTAAPTGTAAQSFCAINNPTVANLAATGTGILWYLASTGGTALDPSTPLVDQTHYYASQTLTGCESDNRLGVLATIGNPTAPAGTATQSFCAINNPTVASLVATGSTIKWYNLANGGTALASNTALVNGNHYYASQTVSGCESASRLDVTITIANPSAPSGTAGQTFCAINNPTVANLVATGTSVQWYTTATGGSVLSSASALVNGTTYYASQTVGSCESATRLAVTVTIDNPATPSGSSAQTFCAITNPTLSNIVITGTNIKWYSAASGGTALASNTPLIDQTHYYASQTVAGCESNIRLGVLVTIGNPTAPTGTASQSFCAINNPTVANLAVSGSAIQWYATATGGTALTTSTSLVTGTHYYASQTVTGCESATRLDITVTIANPNAPTGTTTQSFCAINNPTIANLTATGTNIKWYVAATGGTALSTSLTLVNGTTYYASQTIASCESTTRLAVNVTVANPVNPSATATQSFCTINNPTIANLSATGTSIKWYAAATGGTALDPSTLLTNGGNYYASQTLSGCESATRTGVSVTIADPIAPTGTATQSFCAINNPTIANLVASGTSVQWYTSATGGTALTTNTALVTGTHYYASQTIGSCESATRLDVTVTIANPTAPNGTAAQTFCAINNPTVANLTATGTTIKWYAAATGGIALASTTNLVTGTHYYASQTVSGCESATRFDVTVTINNPIAPSGATSQAFCSINTPTVAQLVATGTVIQWYALSTGGTALAISTPLINGNHYYGSQTVNGCESATRLGVTINISNPAAPTGTATQSFCTINNPTVANLTASGTAVQWYATATGGTPLNNSTALVSGNHYFASQTIGSCESATRLDVVVTIANPTAPSGTATQTFCASNNPTVANLVASGTAIKWYANATGGTELTTTLALVNGTTYYASQTVGSCESATRFAVTATVANPDAPTAIAIQSFCSNTNPTVANLTTSASITKWYTTPIGGTELAPSTSLINTMHYYASQIIEGCGSSDRFDVTAIIQENDVVSITCGTSTPSSVSFDWTTVSGASGYIVSYQAGSNPIQNIGNIGNLQTYNVTGIADGQNVQITVTPVGVACPVAAVWDCRSANCPVPTTDAISDITVCAGDIVNQINFTSPEKASGYTWTNTNTNIGLSSSGNGNILSFTTNAVTQQEISNISIQAFESGCFGPTQKFKITVNPLPLKPIVGTISHPTCSVATGSVALSGLPASGNWIVSATPVSGSGTTTLTLNSTGSNATFAGLIANTVYSFTVRNANSCTSEVSTTNASINNQPITPEAPTTSDANQAFCSINSPTVTNLSTVETNGIKWYNSLTSTTPLNAADALANGTYYATQTLGVCESTNRLLVNVTINDPNAPTTSNTNQSFCAIDPHTVANLSTIETAGIKWYDSPTSNIVLALTDELATGTYYATQTIGFCESDTRLAINVIVNDPSAPSTSNGNQEFCAIDNPTVANLSASGASGAIIKWYALPTGGASLNASDALDNGIYYATQTVGGCESDTRLAINVIVQNPNAPTTNNSAQEFCAINLPTVANLSTIENIGIKWYNSLTSTTPLNLTDTLTNGTYFASQTIGSCESIIRLTVNVTIKNPNAPTTNNSNQEFCAINLPTVANLSTIETTEIKWYNSPTSTIVLSTSSPLSNGTYYATQTIGNCEGTNRLSIKVTVNDPSEPTTSNGNQSFCAINNPTISNLSADGLNIKWYTTLTGGIASNSTDALVNGTYYATQTVGLCESDTRLPINVTVNDPNAPISTNTNQQFCAIDLPTVANLNAIPSAGGTIKWYNVPTGGVALSASDKIADGIYYASETVGLCESDTRLTVNVTIQDPNIPSTSNTDQNFCEISSHKVSDLVAIGLTGAVIKWYRNANTGLALNSTDELVTGTYYASQTLDGCESTKRLAVNVIVGDPNEPNTTKTNQNFCSINNPTVSNLEANGLNIKWYTTLSGGTVLNATDALVNGTYYATQTVENCESNKRLIVNVIVYDPNAPTTSSANQEFCAIDLPTVANLNANPSAGGTIKWYNVPIGGASLSASDKLTNGIYYATETVGLCESDTRLTVNVTLKDPIAPSTSNTNQNFCEISSHKVSDLIATGLTGAVIKWYKDPIAGLALNSTDDLVTGTYYATQTADGCESTTRLAVNVIVGDPNAPNTNSGNQKYCKINNPTVANLVANGLNIKWYTTLNGGTPLNISDALTNGTYYATQTIGLCESDTRLTVNVIINDPVAPTTTNANQEFCAIDLPTVSNLNVNPSASGTIKWYNVPTGGIALSASDKLADGIYYASETVGTCESVTRLTVNVTINNPEAPTISNTQQTFCEENLPIVADLTVTPKASGVIKWYNSLTSTTALNPNDALTEGTYYASETIGLCESINRTSILVTVTNLALMTPDEGCEDADYVLHIRNTNQDTGITYQWLDASDNNLSVTTSSMIITTPGTYKVKVFKNTCFDEYTFDVDFTYCEIPKGISPNGDGLNDNFDLSNLKVKKLEIFNRYGMEMYSKMNYKNEWEGYSDSGLNLPDGTYYYVIQFESGKTKTGWVYKNSER